MKTIEVKQEFKHHIEAIEYIEEARKESESLLASGQLLLDGESMDHALEPVSFTDCQLGQWIYSDGQVFKGHSWFEEVIGLHEKSHDAYSKLYHETLKIYNPKTHDELQDYFINLEANSKALVKKLEDAKEILKNMPEDSKNEAEELQGEELKQELKQELQGEDLIQKPKQESELTSKEADTTLVDLPQAQVFPVQAATADEEPLSDLQQQLKTQDLQQLGHEKQLLELEIKQLEERHQLTAQGLEQLIQYQLLKQKEQEQLSGKNKQAESIKRDVLSIKKLELEEIIKEKQQKQQELEKMELVSNKLDHKKNEEKAQNEEKLKVFEQKKQTAQADIDQLNDEQQAKQTNLEQLEKQVSLLKEEIHNLQIKKDEKSNELKSIQDSFIQNKQEIDNINLKQQQINLQKQDVEELKRKELQQLEEKQQKLNEEVQQLEQELHEVKDQEESSLIEISQVIKQLDEEKIIKSNNLEKIEQEKQQKKQKLAQIEKSYIKIKEPEMAIE